MQALQLRLKTISSTSKAGGGPGVAGTSSLDGPREVEHRMRASMRSHVRKRCVAIVIMASSSKRAAIHNNDGWLYPSVSLHASTALQPVFAIARGHDTLKAALHSQRTRAVVTHATSPRRRCIHLLSCTRLLCCQQPANASPVPAFVA